MERNAGFVNVGISGDSAEFAVESLPRWWKLDGRRHYPRARALLIRADSGGHTGFRTHSKWNQIERRRFSFISLNRRGTPRVSYQTVVNLIGGTRTRTALRIKARPDPRRYRKGLKITDAQMEDINIEPHRKHPQWNYTIGSRKGYQGR